ncbi:hypothetical protein B0H14DRAFT_3485841 [Mycena olivaceomarginata]|nr:hypothetical protein B0H14DRAFT_3485841 [Mycena olivaceomarginata]
MTTSAVVTLRLGQRASLNRNLRSVPIPHSLRCRGITSSGDSGCGRSYEPRANPAPLRDSSHHDSHVEDTSSSPSSRQLIHAAITTPCNSALSGRAARMQTTLASTRHRTARLSQLCCDLRARGTDPHRTTMSISGSCRRLQDVFAVFAARRSVTMTSHACRTYIHFLIAFSHTGHDEPLRSIRTPLEIALVTQHETPTKIGYVRGASAQLGSTAVGGAESIALWEMETALARRARLLLTPLPSGHGLRNRLPRTRALNLKCASGVSSLPTPSSSSSRNPREASLAAASFLNVELAGERRASLSCVSPFLLSPRRCQDGQVYAYTLAPLSIYPACPTELHRGLIAAGVTPCAGSGRWVAGDFEAFTATRVGLAGHALSNRIAPGTGARILPIRFTSNASSSPGSSSTLPPLVRFPLPRRLRTSQLPSSVRHSPSLSPLSRVSRDLPSSYLTLLSMETWGVETNPTSHHPLALAPSAFSSPWVPVSLLAPTSHASLLPEFGGGVTAKFLFRTLDFGNVSGVLVIVYRPSLVPDAVVLFIVGQRIFV